MNPSIKLNSSPRSRLYYHGTGLEIELGDRVRVTRWYFWQNDGIVCYIPGISKPHSELEYEDVAQWAIRLDDGIVLAMGYFPESPYGQPSKNIKFVARATGEELARIETLE